MKTGYMAVILKRLLDGETLTSSDSYIVNTNQYFVAIKKAGVELVEVWKHNANNSGKHKERRLHDTLENIAKAKKLLNKLQGK